MAAPNASGKIRLGIEWALLQFFQRQLLRLFGVRVGFIQLLRVESAAAHPGQRRDHLRRNALAGAVFLNDRIAQREIVLRRGLANIVDHVRPRLAAASRARGISFDSIYIEDNKRPPSTTMVCPVRYDDASLASSSATSAISGGWPRCRIGCCDINCVPACASSFQ